MRSALDKAKLPEISLNRRMFEIVCLLPEWIRGRFGLVRFVTLKALKTNENRQLRVAWL
jgi:hypothetical protein